MYKRYIHICHIQARLYEVFFQIEIIALLLFIKNLGIFFIILTVMSEKKVLIIDDEIDLCILLKNFLTKQHCDVAISHKLSDGLKEALDFVPDIIFLDNNLPDSQGWTKASYLLDALPNADIFLISAYKSTPSIPESPRITVIEKPLSLKAIGQLIA